MRRVRTGHADAEDVLLADRFDRNGCDQRRIDSAAQADQHAAEAALADVIASSEYQRVQGRFVAHQVIGMIVAVAGVGIEKDQIFFERFGRVAASLPSAVMAKLDPSKTS